MKFSDHNIYNHEFMTNILDLNTQHLNKNKKIKKIKTQKLKNVIFRAHVDEKTNINIRNVIGEYESLSPNEHHNKKMK